MDGKRRTTLRYDVELAARIAIRDQLITCEVRDVSLGGVFVHGPALTAGTRVSLRFDSEELHGIEVPCIARWHDDRGSGLQFERLGVVDPSTLARLVRTSRNAGRLG